MDKASPLGRVRIGVTEMGEIGGERGLAMHGDGVARGRVGLSGGRDAGHGGDGKGDDG